MFDSIPLLIYLPVDGRPTIAAWFTTAMLEQVAGSHNIQSNVHITFVDVYLGLRRFAASPSASLGRPAGP
ncbi:hypothetical protein [Blastopirellula marina]|uniref:hypothetical protein n=1 Tax=Blastopirellula marina TaxID=124 RepID=UPI00030F0A65|nr:hypothetical protein [Blastopirellula marina]